MVEARSDAAEVEAERDALIRRAATHGIQRTRIAEAAGISRERLYQIL